MLSAHIDRHLLDNAADERERRLVVTADRLPTIASNAKTFTHQREVADLRLDLRAADLLVVDVERRGPRGNTAISALEVELHPQDRLARGDGGARGHLLLDLTEQIVDVAQLAIFEVERVPAEPTALREEHARRLGGLQVHLGQDAVRAIADADRHGLGHIGDIRIVDVVIAWLAELGPWAAEDRDSPTVLERQPIVLPASTHHRFFSSSSCCGN